MCTPKTKIEREVDRLHRQLPALSNRQKNWAIKNCSRYEWTRPYKGRAHCDVEHFIIVTAKNDWQVLRHFYIYSYYKRERLSDVEFLPVMEQWYREGQYVFYSLSRFGMSYCNDAWSRNSDMTIKRGQMEGHCLDDPRELGYCDIRFEKVLPQFQYVTPYLGNCNIGKVYRAVNTDPIWETIFKYDMQEYIWCAKNFITGDKRLTAAVKIARRHHYDYQSQEWLDLVNMLMYLHMDYRNPKYICPADLKAVHDEISRKATTKREKLQAAARAAVQLRAERAELERIRQDEQARENYPKMRKQFFGLLIAGQGLEIKCLQSVEEFMEEGTEMHHCVFGNAYYDTKRHPNSLILSAKKDGQRIETIEVDLRDYHIVQSRGKHNSCTAYHDTIVELVNDNIGMIRKANRRKTV